MSITSPKDLFQAIREVCRLRHLSYRTEQTYLSVIHNFVRFHKIQDQGSQITLGGSQITLGGPSITIGGTACFSWQRNGLPGGKLWR
jgi:hypothetical protein